MVKVREILPDSVKEDFDAIVGQKILGASRHISMIGNMIEAILLEGEAGKRDTRQMIADIKTVSEYFIRTRGEASQAVSNAIKRMTYRIDKWETLKPEEAVVGIRSIKDSYEEESKEMIQKIIAYSIKLACKMDRIFVYDYSSTVEKFLSGLSENKKKYTVYIAESRVIDGGKPFVSACKKAGHAVKFIPEASMMYYLKECDAAFMGAETFYPDGTGFNTTGSDIVGLICKHYDIPLYFLTPLIKVDIRPVIGEEKNLVFQNLEKKLSEGWEEPLKQDVDFITPELIGVKPEFISAYVTELGIIPAGQMYACSMEYSKYLQGDREE